MLQKYSSYNPKEPVLPCKTGTFGLQLILENEEKTKLV